MVSLYGVSVASIYLTLKKAFHPCQDLRLHGVGVDFGSGACFLFPQKLPESLTPHSCPLPSISIPHLKPSPSPSGIWSESTGCRLPKQSLYLY